VALTATVYNFDITLSDVDRGVYEILKLKAAKQPSETMSYLLTRVFAYCLQYRPGITFSKGLAEPDEPAVWAHDLTGGIELWVEIGSPSPERLHKATKLGAEVVVYLHKGPKNFLSQLGGKQIYRAEEIKIYAFPPKFFDELMPLIDRRTSMVISVSDSVLYLSTAGRDFSLELTPLNDLVE